MAAETLVPTSADEAARLFGDGDGLTVFAGGTILLPEISAGRLKPERALMLHRSGLDEIDSEGGALRIGAMTPVAALVGGPNDLLSRFAEHVGDGEVRRNATVGGNLCATPGVGAQRGDLGCRRVIADAGRQIGTGVANLCNLLNPRRVILGGDLAEAGDLVLDPIRESVARYAIPSAARQLSVVPGTLGGRAEVLGALALVMSEMVD